MISLVTAAVPELLAWACTVAGWLGLTSLGLGLAPFRVAAYWPLAACLLVHGLAPFWLHRPPVRAARRLPVAVALVFAALALAAPATRSLPLAVLAGGAWALLTALVARPGPGEATTAGAWGGLAGALVGGILLGDPANGHGAAQAMAILGLAATAAGRLPACRWKTAFPATHPGCMVLPGLSPAPGRWAGTAAALVMIPMMTTLPAMAGLCAAGGWPTRGVVAGHLLAMFLPALLLARLAGPLSAGRAGSMAGCLMVMGALPLAVGAGGQADGVPGVMLLQGAAWGMVWLASRRDGLPARSIWPLAVLPAALALGAGALATVAGPAGIEGIHLALGGLAAAGLVWTALAGLWPPGRKPFNLARVKP
jgi:hypothetical protein